MPNNSLSSCCTRMSNNNYCLTRMSSLWLKVVIALRLFSSSCALIVQGFFHFHILRNNIECSTFFLEGMYTYKMLPGSYYWAVAMADELMQVATSASRGHHRPISKMWPISQPSWMAQYPAHLTPWLCRQGPACSSPGSPALLPFTRIVCARRSPPCPAGRHTCKRSPR